MEDQPLVPDQEPKKSSDRLPTQKEPEAKKPFSSADFAPNSLSPEVKFADVLVWYKVNEAELDKLVVATGVLPAYRSAFSLLKGNTMPLSSLGGGLREQVMTFLDELSKREVAEILRNPSASVPRTQNEIFEQMRQVMGTTPGTENRSAAPKEEPKSGAYRLPPKSDDTSSGIGTLSGVPLAASDEAIRATRDVAKEAEDFERRIGNMTGGTTGAGKPITPKDVGIEGVDVDKIVGE